MPAKQLYSIHFIVLYPLIHSLTSSHCNFLAGKACYLRDKPVSEMRNKLIYKQKKRFTYKEHGNRGVVILKNSKKWGSRKKSRVETEKTEGQRKAIASSCLLLITTHRPLSLLRCPWPAVTDQQDSKISSAPLTSYVTGHQLLILPNPQVPHLWNRDQYINLSHRVVLKVETGNAYDVPDMVLCT